VLPFIARLAHSDPPLPGSPTSGQVPHLWPRVRRGEAIGPASNPANTGRVNHYRYLVFSPDRCSTCGRPKDQLIELIFRVIDPPGAAGNFTP